MTGRIFVRQKRLVPLAPLPWRPQAGTTVRSPLSQRSEDALRQRPASLSAHFGTDANGLVGVNDGLRPRPPSCTSPAQRRGSAAPLRLTTFYAGAHVDIPPQHEPPGPHVSGSPLQKQVNVPPPFTSSISERFKFFIVSLFRDSFLLVFFMFPSCDVCIAPQRLASMSSRQRLLQVKPLSSQRSCFDANIQAR